MELRQIGVVRTAVTERKKMPPLGAASRVEVFPEFAEGLLRIGKHSHIWVLVWLHQAERDLLLVTPRGVRDTTPAGLHGVFAVRAPVRPNPIGLTAARVLGIRDLSIELDRLDFLDGTPVIDLKPYFVTRDSILSANNAAIGRPLSREALRESLFMQALHLHGEGNAEVALAVRVIEHFRSRFLDLAEPPAWHVEVPLNRPCVVDAVMGMTRATPGRGSLLFGPEDEVRIVHAGSVYLYVLPPGNGDRERIWTADDETLFRFEVLPASPG